VYVRALEAAASPLGVSLTPAGVRDAAEIERMTGTLGAKEVLGWS
jgi:hypothetical protein